MQTWRASFVVCLLFIVLCDNVIAIPDVQTTVVVCDKACKRARREAETDVGEQVRLLIEHYKQEDPVGLPGAPIPDPVDVPDMRHSFAVSSMTFKNQKVHGLSKFRFQHIRADLAKLEMAVGVRIETLLITGQYTLGGWFSRSSGPFTVNLTDVYVEGIAGLLVDRSGSLAAEDIHMDIKFKNIKLKFENLGGMAYIFQGIVNSVGNVLFDGIKPFILNELNTRILANINENIKKVPQRFPNSIPPLDMAIATVRSDIRARGYDPFHMDNFTHVWGGASVGLTNIWVTGLSSFYRVGEVSLGVVNNVANATVQVGTQRVEGTCNWQISVGWLTRTGTTKFWVDYVQVRASVLQPMNVERRPEIDKLSMKVGNIQTRVNGAGTLDYVAEFVLNVFPNVLRYQLVSLIEDPIRQQIQEQLNQINVEEIILEQLKQHEASSTAAKAAAEAAEAEETEAAETESVVTESVLQEGDPEEDISREGPVLVPPPSLQLDEDDYDIHDKPMNEIYSD